MFTYTHHTQIRFLHGADGQPWVWVMGEHKDDLPYAELVREEGREERKKEGREGGREGGRKKGREGGREERREGGRERERERKRGVGQGVDEGRSVNECERTLGVNKGRCK